MKKETNIILRIAFGIVAAIVIFGVFPDSAFDRMKIGTAISTLGALISLFSGVLILIRAAEGVDALRLLPLGIALLGGALIATGNGVVALALALAVASVLIREGMGHQRGGRSENPGGGGGGGGNRPRRRPSGGGDKDQKQGFS